MRPAHWAIAISAATHAVAIAWVNVWPRDTEEKEEELRVVAVEVTTAKREPEWVPVVLLDGDSVSASVASGAGATGERHMATGDRAKRGTGDGQPATGNGKKSRGMSMGMRGNEPPRLNGGLSAAFMDKFLSREVEAYVPPPPSGDLEANGRGTYRTTKEPMQPFDATVAPDGSVKIKDRPSVGDFHVPRWHKIPLPMIVGRVSIDDAIMHAKGYDPYASAKLRFLDRTRDERVAIGNEYRKQQLSKSAALMRDNLARLWQQPLDARARKQAVFELWDECAETGEQAVIDGGALARTYLIGFVRSHLPAGSADAFTADELATLNAKRRRESKPTFAPYE